MTTIPRLADLEGLLDANAFLAVDDDGEVAIENGPVWGFDVDGVQWLTDRRWLLPGHLLNDRCPVIEQEKATRVGRDLVQRLGSVTLGEPQALFAPALAGPLTVAGLTARPVVGDDVYGAHVLVDAEGERVGWVMPMRLAPAPHPPMLAAYIAVSIPVATEVVELQARIEAAGVIRVSEAWKVAAALAQSNDRIEKCFDRDCDQRPDVLRFDH